MRYRLLIGGGYKYTDADVETAFSNVGTRLNNTARYIIVNETYTGPKTKVIVKVDIYYIVPITPEYVDKINKDVFDITAQQVKDTIITFRNTFIKTLHPLSIGSLVSGPTFSGNPNKYSGVVSYTLDELKKKFKSLE